MRADDNAEEDPGIEADSTAGPGERLLLIDSDAFTLLAATGRLEPAIECLGYTRDDARRLQPLPHMLRKGKFDRHRFTPDEMQTILQWCDRIAPLRESSPAHFLQELTDLAGIHPGEATMLAFCRHQRSTVLLTGDKTALVALATKAPKFCKKLRGRIASIDQILLTLVSEHGAGCVVTAIAARIDHSKTLTVCFSEGNRVDQAACQLALQSYVQRLVEILPATNAAPDAVAVRRARRKGEDTHLRHRLRKPRSAQRQHLRPGQEAASRTRTS